MAQTDIIQKDLGLVTAYGYALAGGYQGTEEQFKQDFAALMKGQYNALSNKPSINGVELVGNKTSEELGIGVGDVEMADITDYLKPVNFRTDEQCIMYRFGRLTILHYCGKFNDNNRKIGSYTAYQLLATMKREYRIDKLKPMELSGDTRNSMYGEAYMKIYDEDENKTYTVSCNCLYWQNDNVAFALLPLIGTGYVENKYSMQSFDMKIGFINSYTGEEESNTGEEESNTDGE